VQVEVAPETENKKPNNPNKKRVKVEDAEDNQEDVKIVAKKSKVIDLTGSDDDNETH
jgi:hypothetical protein